MHEIRMQHPGKNALGTDLVGWLDEELRRAGDEPILLTGTDDAFSAGLNLKEVHAADRAAMEALLRRLDGLFARLFLHPAPTVACVNGHAIAGGCILMLCCDWRIATDDPRVRIGVNELALGACIPPVALSIVKRRVPPHVLDQVVLGAGLHAPATALALGLVDEVSPDAPSAALKRIQALSAHPRATYAVTKRALRSGMIVVSAEDEQRFRENEVPIWASKEMKERVAAVLRR
ncbi:MAG: enoyl-CoA hydratase/isomerase family protein [Planctomycetes bacterium]|nr:enoyl-CoA hydratase/isomerase family protein [Planctomycetota bacterium]